MFAIISLGGVFGDVRPPLRVAFFAWSAALAKILVLDNLRKRKITVIDWYCMCKKSGETFDHPLLHCEIANALWNSILDFFGSMGHAPSRNRFLSCWRGSGVVLKVKLFGR
jgi:hypothetical protein